MPSSPTYVVTPYSLATYYDRVAHSDLPQMKIYDFDSGEPFSPDPHRILIMPPVAHEACTLPLSFGADFRASCREDC